MEVKKLIRKQKVVKNFEGKDPYVCTSTMHIIILPRAPNIISYTLYMQLIENLPFLMFLNEIDFLENLQTLHFVTLRR
jgi:hypothetical protein